MSQLPLFLISELDHALPDTKNYASDENIYRFLEIASMTYCSHSDAAAITSLHSSPTSHLLFQSMNINIWDDRGHGRQFIATLPQERVVVLAFSGSYNLWNWLNDAGVIFVDPDKDVFIGSFPKDSKIHLGFQEELENIVNQHPSLIQRFFWFILFLFCIKMTCSRRALCVYGISCSEDNGKDFESCNFSKHRFVRLSTSIFIFASRLILFGVLKMAAEIELDHLGPDALRYGDSTVDIGSVSKTKPSSSDFIDDNASSESSDKSLDTEEEEDEPEESLN